MKRLNQDIKNHSFAAVYLLYGDEDYLCTQYKNRLFLAASGGDGMNSMVKSGKDPELAPLRDFTDTLPFFAERRVLLLEDTGLFKHSAEGYDAWIESLPDTACVIFSEKEVDKRNRLYKAVIRKGYAAELNRPDERMLEDWILRRIGQQHLSVTKEAFRRFLEICEPDMQSIDNELQKLSSAIDKAKKSVCARVRVAYPAMFDELQGIGHYVLEFKTDRFCASWNKAYCTHDIGKDGKRHFSFTLAGIPTRRRENKVSSFIGLNGYADRLYSLGWSYQRICELFLGYNTTFANDVIRLNARKFPEWGETLFEKVTDCNGDSALVAEPLALALYPMSKTVNDTKSAENAVNMRYALANNENVNTKRKLVCAKGVLDLEGVLNEIHV